MGIRVQNDWEPKLGKGTKGCHLASSVDPVINDFFNDQLNW
jgi:hypothetical protein